MNKVRPKIICACNIKKKEQEGTRRRRKGKRRHSEEESEEQEILDCTFCNNSLTSKASIGTTTIINSTFAAIVIVRGGFRETKNSEQCKIIILECRTYFLNMETLSYLDESSKKALLLITNIFLN